jgi:predicted enzyme related to lactoylglutathione lyase
MALRDRRAVAGIGLKLRPGMLSAWTTYFAVDDADAIARKVTSSGGQVLVPPFDVLNAGRMSIAADSTGGVFGLWQARAHIGSAVYNEPGAYRWNELHTRQLDTAKQFYADVFGLSYTETAGPHGPALDTRVGDGMAMRYVMFAPPGGSEDVGGMCDDSLTPVDPMPSYWLTWFQFEDVDAGVERIAELDGTVVMPPTDSPPGRMAVVSAPQGETFGLVDASVRRDPSDGSHSP